MTGSLLATGHFGGADAALLVVVVVLLAASALLALAETSLVRTNRAKALALREQHRRGSARLVRLVEDPQAFLNPILLLVLVCQLVTATLVGILAEQLFGALGVLAATAFEVVVIFVLAEALPKNWAVYNPERSALFAAPLVAALVGFPPVRMLSNGLIRVANLLVRQGHRESAVSESELLAMADVAMEEEVIEHQERELIHSIIGFGDTVVREVMVPRPDMKAVESDASVSEALGVAIAAGFSRLPVHEGNLDDVVGIAYAKDLIRAERDGEGGRPVGDFVRPARFVPETKRVSSLMREMQERKYHQAIVVDEYGGTSGLVTLEDLIEELVGEIVDEFDVEEPPVQALAEGEVSVTARLPVDELNDLLHAHLPEGDWDTVGGLLFNVLGRVPAEGESVEVDGVRLVAERVQGHRIGRIRILQLAAPAPAGADDAEQRERD
ncbi:MAG TPA: hemolysin family protein [Acidimicrobiales bacterium]|nr:hemolysin family protein [Acidimicrobiales bacterium]